jgi:hypothetical protein
MDTLHVISLLDQIKGDIYNEIVNKNEKNSVIENTYNIRAQ